MNNSMITRRHFYAEVDANYFPSTFSTIILHLKTIQFRDRYTLFRKKEMQLIKQKHN